MQETPGKGREPIKDILVSELPQEAQGAQRCWDTRGNRNGVRCCLRSGGGVGVNTRQSAFESRSLICWHFVGGGKGPRAQMQSWQLEDGQSTWGDHCLYLLQVTFE